MRVALPVYRADAYLSDVKSPAQHQLWSQVDTPTGKKNEYGTVRSSAFHTPTSCSRRVEFKQEEEYA